MFALCAVLVAAGALGAAFAYTSVSDTQEVLVVNRDIARGETIEPGDLTVVRVSVDPALTPISGSQKSSIEGSRAAVDLWAGTLLSEQQVTENLVPGEGESLVGISLTPAQMPSEPLYSGDTVRIVTTPGDQGEVTEQTPSRSRPPWLVLAGWRRRGRPSSTSRSRRRSRPTSPRAPPPAASRSSSTPGSAEPWR